MREAKHVATIFGTIIVCLFSGLFVASNSAPDVNSSNTLEIVEPASEEMMFAAEKTSVSTTTTIVTTIATTTTEDITTTTASETTASETTEPEEIVTEPQPAEVIADNTAAEAAAAPVQEEEVTVPETEAETEAEPVPEETESEETETSEEEADTTDDEEDEDNGLPVSDEDFIILCNIVGHEAGSCWISETEKAKVVEVVMNRVNSPLFPDSISAVLTQPGQFTGSQYYAFNGSYCGYVTEQVINAVRLYFDDTASFNHGYLYFWGDGYQNHFS
jgi:hypothetical protein